jgi:hypothetical protein
MAPYIGQVRRIAEIPHLEVQKELVFDLEE